MSKRVATLALMTLLLSGCSAASEESQTSTSPEIVEESPTEANPQSGQQNSVPESEETAASEAEGDASPFETPFPKDFAKEQIIEAALQSFNEYLSFQEGELEATLLFQESFPESQIDWVERIIGATSASLPFPEGSEAFIVLAVDDEFISEQFKSAGIVPSYGLPPCGITTYESYCAGPGWAAFNYSSSAKNIDEFSFRGKKAVVAHELLHLWQFAVAAKGGNSTNAPMWLEEGFADFFGFATGESLGLESYLECRTFSLSNNYFGDRPLEDHEGYELNPYGIGLLAAEYLVASVGIRPVLGIYELLGQGLSFEDAFGQSIGLELEAFYEMFESTRGNFS